MTPHNMQIFWVSRFVEWHSNTEITIKEWKKMKCYQVICLWLWCLLCLECDLESRPLWSMLKTPVVVGYLHNFQFSPHEGSSVPLMPMVNNRPTVLVHCRSTDIVTNLKTIFLILRVVLKTPVIVGYLHSFQFSPRKWSSVSLLRPIVHSRPTVLVHCHNADIVTALEEKKKTFFILPVVYPACVIWREQNSLRLEKQFFICGFLLMQNWGFSSSSSVSEVVIIEFFFMCVDIVCAQESTVTSSIYIYI